MRKKNTKNLLKGSRAYYDNNDYYEMFSLAEDGEGKVAAYIKDIVGGMIVLDAGCGTGKFLKVIESVSNKYIGVDLSEQQLFKARKKSTKSNSEFICSDLSNIPLENNSVDFILSSWVLGTIVNLDERKKCLDKLKKLLKPGGKILLVENDLNSEFEMIRGRNNDRKTFDYNQWIIQQDFSVINRIDTFFNFSSLEKCIHCFDVIYGKNVSSKIISNRINHNIILFSYTKNSVEN